MLALLKATFLAGAEAFFREGPPERICSIFVYVFSHACNSIGADAETVKEGDKKAEEAKSDALCDFLLEEREQYKNRVSKWVRGSLSCAADQMFWFLIYAANETRKPLMRFFCALSADSSHTAVSKSGPTSDLPIVKLITRRAPESEKDLQHMQRNFDLWTDVFIDLAADAIKPFAHKAIPADRAEMKMFALQLLTHNHAAFRRRVVEVCSLPLGSRGSWALGCLDTLASVTV